MSGNRRDVRDFLVSRRAKITPQQAGLTSYGGNRRVPGLRREEAAMLAGVSVDYYTRLEKGNLAGASDTVLHAIADALQLDEAERTHLLDLARAANTSIRAPRRRPADSVRPSVQHILDGMTEVPAFVRNGHLDLLAATRLGRALYAPVFDSPTRVNAEAGRDPHDKDLIELVGELPTRSEEFRTRWAAHNVRLHHTGAKKFHHPAVGDLTLAFEAMQISADEGLTLTAYAAEPASASADALRLLASWAATLEAGEMEAPQTNDSNTRNR